MVAQMEQTGVNAVAIFGPLSFLIDIVTAYQGADQLRHFGAEIFSVNTLGVGIVPPICAPKPTNGGLQVMGGVPE